MKSTIFIPKKIKVGYQHRHDTYTQKLAYVIYYDNKGVLRKETSWKGWIHDKPVDMGTYVDGRYQRKAMPGIPPDDFDNEPIEGFVLNKKVGGDRYSWNPRQTYTRVWDPRGFEFEITIPNLLYILENTSSIKGKGLEGKFVYGWDGKELVLIPEQAPEYAEMQEFTNMQDMKVGKADMVPGLRYMTKKQEEITYLGQFTEYGYKQQPSKSKKYWFAKTTMNYNNKPYLTIFTTTGLTNLAKKISNDPDPNFAEYYEKMERRSDFSAISHYALEELSPKEKKEFLKGNEEAFRGYFYTEKNGELFMLNISKSHNAPGDKPYYISSVWGCQNGGAFEILDNYQRSMFGGKYINYSERLLGANNYGTRFTYTAQELLDTFNLKLKKTYLKNGKQEVR